MYPGRQEQILALCKGIEVIILKVIVIIWFSRYENSCERHNYSLELKWSDYPTYQKLRD